MQKDNYLLSACPHRTSVVLKSTSSGQSILIGVGAMAISVLDESSPHPDMRFCSFTTGNNLDIPEVSSYHA